MDRQLLRFVETMSATVIEYRILSFIVFPYCFLYITNIIIYRHQLTAPKYNIGPKKPTVWHMTHINKFEYYSKSKTRVFQKIMFSYIVMTHANWIFYRYPFSEILLSFPIYFISIVTTILTRYLYFKFHLWKIIIIIRKCITKKNILVYTSKLL